MQRVAAARPDSSQAEQFENQIKGLAYAVHKLTVKIPQKLFQIAPFLSISRNGKAASLNEQSYSSIDMSPGALLQKEFVFQIDNTLTSSATRVMFNESDQIKQQICLKMWLKCCNEVYDTNDLTKQATFLIEGLAFNRQFAENVYYGIVPILSDKPDRLKCGPLIAEPALTNLTISRPYALVMNRLKKEWRLDHQLQLEKTCYIRDMEFLADQIARMHRQLNRSLPEFATPERIVGKFEFNIEQFHKALDERRVDPGKAAASTFSKVEMKWIESASSLLRQLNKAHQYDFKKRHREGHIRRCHGDLKATNLWICSPENGSQAQKRLVALDCVDFNPEFCNIDTLSDVAMLAVDLEMRLENATKNGGEKLSGQHLSRHFLQTYLKAASESEAVWPLLECYITEKAMVCAYMSIVYDGLPSLGEKYLKVVLAHSQELAKYLPPHVGKRVTKSLQPVLRQDVPVALELPQVIKKVAEPSLVIAN